MSLIDFIVPGGSTCGITVNGFVWLAAVSAVVLFLVFRKDTRQSSGSYASPQQQQYAYPGYGYRPPNPQQYAYPGAATAAPNYAYIPPRVNTSDNAFLGQLR